MPRIDGFKEEMPNGVRCVSLQYGCKSCRHGNGTEYGNACKINPMMTVMLILKGWRDCPLRDKSEKEIEEWLKS